MADVIGIIGLTIAIFDQLIKLGERTAELTSDIRGFDQDSRKLYSDIKHEEGQTRSLKRLLFNSSAAYGGQTLFEQFEPDIQDQIRELVEEPKSILQDAYELLESRYGSSGVKRSTSNASRKPVGSGLNSGSSPSTPIEKSLSSMSLRSPSEEQPGPGLWRSRSNRSPLLMMRWSLRDKKRLSRLVSAFQDCNKKVREDVEALVSESRLGIDQQHLQHLRTDDSSRSLGFDTSAALTLTLNQAQSDPRSHELKEKEWLQYISHDSAVERRFSLIKTPTKNYLQENRAYTSHPQMPTTLDARTQDRVNRLARLLEQPKGPVFRILHCVGWKFDASRCRIAFIFDIPAAAAPKPLSLLKLLYNEDAEIHLGKKFQLAYNLSECICRLHTARWVHESFRSENVLFFPLIDPDTGDVFSPTRIDYSQPWVMGFDFSRPEDDFSSGFVDIDVTRDVWRHPERQGQPTKIFKRIHDIYALGVVLLEIGLWEPAINMEKNQFKFTKDPWGIQSLLIKRAEKHLEYKVGEKYKDVVLKCLKGNFGDRGSDSAGSCTLQEFRSEVVDVLKKAAESI